MHKAIPVTLAILAAISAGGCSKGSRASAYAAQVADGIKAQEAQWQKDYAAKDINALAGHYADDAALAGPGDALATGDAERRKVLQDMVTDPNLKVAFSSDRIEVAKSGDLASSRGHYSLTLTDKATNKPVETSGTYLTVYKKQADGSWKAVEDMITPGPAPKTAAK